MIYPNNIVLEVTTKCNLICKGCALHGPSKCVDRPTGSMAQFTWEKVIHEIGSWNRPVSVIAHGGGEPLIHPQLKQIIHDAKRYPHVTIGFLTNGMLLDESWTEYLISAGLDWISFSIDGVSPETHRQIRKNSDLKTIESNLRFLIHSKRKSGNKKRR